MLPDVGRLWRTVRHLRPIQVYGRLLRRLRTPRVDEAAPSPPRRTATGPWRRPARREPGLLAANRVRFLNVEATLPETGGWNDPRHEKLWLYNLHYFDDLPASGWAGRVEWQRSLLNRWIAENPPGAGNGWEPYPLSIRISNLIKWLTGSAAADHPMITSLAVQARWLEQSVEWHLLGNHLFSNAKALTMAGLFFEGPEADRWLARGLGILDRELPEQILPDGGNFERSPMYHALMAEDLLDLVNLAARYPGTVPEAQLGAWREAAGRMLAWLADMSHPDGRIAFFNDAAFGIAPENAELLRYAADLGVATPTRPASRLRRLAESGYVRLTLCEAVALLDVAPIGPDYLPGHAHADTLSFELSVGGQRFIVNGGTSRYGNDAVRAYERSTAAHSTVEVSGRSSSEVWHGFRVGERARPLGIEVSDAGETLHVSAGHDGYRRLPGAPIHRRSWAMTDAGMTITDTLSDARHPAVARYILPPEIRIEVLADGAYALVSPSAGRILLRIAAGRGAIQSAWYGPEFGRRFETSAIAITLDDGRAQAVIDWA